MAKVSILDLRLNVNRRFFERTALTGWKIIPVRLIIASAWLILVLWIIVSVFSGEILPVSSKAPTVIIIVGSKVSIVRVTVSVILVIVLTAFLIVSCAPVHITAPTPV